MSSSHVYGNNKQQMAKNPQDSPPKQPKTTTQFQNRTPPEIQIFLTKYRHYTSSHDLLETSKPEADKESHTAS